MTRLFGSSDFSADVLSRGGSRFFKGGGTAQNLSFPTPASGDTTSATYMYQHWIVTDLDALITAARAVGSPYQSETVPNPEDFFGDVLQTSDAVLTQFKADVAAMAGTTTFESDALAVQNVVDNPLMFPAINIASDVAVAQGAERAIVTSAMQAAFDAAADALASSPYQSMVDAYEKRIKARYMRTMSQVAAGLSDIGAVNSSAFVWGLASVLNDMNDDVANFAATLSNTVFQTGLSEYMATFRQAFSDHLKSAVAVKLQRAAARDSMLTQGPDFFLREQNNRIEYQMKAAMLQMELNKGLLESKIAELNRQMEVDEQDALWDFKLYGYGANMLSAAGGAGSTQAGMSAGQQTLSATFAGAAIGASVGGPAAPLTAAIGGAVGFIGSMFT